MPPPLELPLWVYTLWHHLFLAIMCKHVNHIQKSALFINQIRVLSLIILQTVSVRMPLLTETSRITVGIKRCAGVLYHLHTDNDERPSHIHRQHALQNLVKFGHLFLRYACRQIQRQRDIQTHWLQYLDTPSMGGVNTNCGLTSSSMIVCSFNMRSVNSERPLVCFISGQLAAGA